MKNTKTLFIRHYPMKSTLRLMFNVAAGFLILTACNRSPAVLKDMSNDSYPLLSQDSTTLRFPADFNGAPVIVAYIYTHCQSVCPAITANMKNISAKLPANSPVRMVLITFDPMRDTPAVLKKYMREYELDADRFTMLTGDSTTVYSLMDQIGIRAKVTRDSSMAGMGYMFNHTNQVNLVDAEGRIRGEYGGSMVPPEEVIADLKKL